MKTVTYHGSPGSVITYGNYVIPAGVPTEVPGALADALLAASYVRVTLEAGNGPDELREPAARGTGDVLTGMTDTRSANVREDDDDNEED